MNKDSNTRIVARIDNFGPSFLSDLLPLYCPRHRTLVTIRRRTLLPILLAPCLGSAFGQSLDDNSHFRPAQKAQILHSAISPQLPDAQPTAPTLRMNFSNAPSSEVIELYRELIPEDLVVDSGVSMGRPITLQTKGEVSREKAIEMIESTLMLNGYSLVQSAPDIVKVLGPAKFPRSQGLPVYYSLSELPKGQRVVSYFMKLNHVTPNDAVNLFCAQVSPPNPYTSFMAVPSANAVIITESTSVIRQLVGMQASFDVASKSVPSEPKK